MTYLGSAVTQLDGSKFAHQNCVLATTSVLGDTSTLGYYNVSPIRLRVLSRDNFGGVDYSVARRALLEGTLGEVDLTVIYYAPQNATVSTLDKILDAPRATAISILASVTRYTPFRTGTFMGGHTITVGDKRTVKVQTGTGSYINQKQALVMDSGHSVAKWVWWPWSLLIKAAKARTGGNSIHVMYTRDLEDVTRVAKSNGAIRSSTKVQRDPSNKVGSLVAKQAYKVLSTHRGGEWHVDGKYGNGWSKIGTNKFVIGGRLR